MASLKSSRDRTSSATFSSSAFESCQQHASSSQNSLSEECIFPRAGPEQSPAGVATAPDPAGIKSKIDGRPSSEIPQPANSSNSTAEKVPTTTSTVRTATGTNSPTHTVESPNCGNLPYPLRQPSIPSTVGLGYLANRRSAPFTQHNGPLHHFIPTAPQSTSSPGLRANTLGDISALSHPLKRTPSLIRFSMSLDGKAQVTTDEGSSPSPPRSQPLPVGTSQRPSGLQRSKSAVGTGNRFSLDQDGMQSQLPRRTMTGRSRDARTWEFYCDSDARNALTEQAEQEQSGSAIGAIGLIRSRSNKALLANPNKRNAQAPSHEAMKRVKPAGQKSTKPKLARTTSSMARLQTGNCNPQKIISAKEKGWKRSPQPTLLQASSWDSDKENWEPGTQTSNIRRARAPDASSQARRAILKESAHIPSHSTSLGALLNQENVALRRPTLKVEGSSEQEQNSEDDEEVAAFMRGSSLPREEEDLDCVQNLLSLSQGAWR